MSKNQKATKPAAKPAAKPQPGTAVSTVRKEDTGSMILVGDKHDLSHINMAASRGNENVQTDDLVIPRLEIVQGLSPAMKPSDPGYVEGAKQGDLLNSVTNRVYGREVFVVPVHYTKQWLVWKKFSEGGGFFGAFNNPDDAEQRKAEVVAGGEKEANIEVIDTPTHLCLLVNIAEHKLEEIMIPLTKTKAKVSRAWNTMIRMTGGDRFARVYRLTTAMEKNKKGQEYYNFVVGASGSPNKVLYQRAEALHKAVTGGKTYTMDTKGYNAEDPGHEGSGSEM